MPIKYCQIMPREGAKLRIVIPVHWIYFFFFLFSFRFYFIEFFRYFILFIFLYHASLSKGQTCAMKIYTCIFFYHQILIFSKHECENFALASWKNETKKKNKNPKIILNYVKNFFCVQIRSVMNSRKSKTIHHCIRSIIILSD